MFCSSGRLHRSSGGPYNDMMHTRISGPKAINRDAFRACSEQDPSYLQIAR
jgi:hypothetical protein